MRLHKNVGMQMHRRRGGVEEVAEEGEGRGRRGRKKKQKKEQK